MCEEVREEKRGMGEDWVEDWRMVVVLKLYWLDVNGLFCDGDSGGC